jgi:hypothetical protein
MVAGLMHAVVAVRQRFVTSAAEHGLWIDGHVDGVPAHLAIPAALRLGREAGPAEDPDLGADLGRAVGERDEPQSDDVDAGGVEPDFDDPDDLGESDDLVSLDVDSDGLDVSLDELDSPPPVPLSDFDPDVAELPRLSVLKKPLPRKVTPTGWNTFLTAIT